MSNYFVRVRLTANSDDNPGVVYYNNNEPIAVFKKYINDGNLTVLSDAINGNQREILYSYSSKEVRDQLKQEVSVFDTSYTYDVTIVVEEGYDLA